VATQRAHREHDGEQHRDREHQRDRLGEKDRYEYATRVFGIPRPMYVSSLSVRSMTITRNGNPSAARMHTLPHSRST